MKLKQAIDLVAGIQKINPDMPLQQLLCLLYIAREEEGCSLTDIARNANIGLATASRYVSSLGKMNRHREEGFNFVESYEDPMERRKKIIRLTTKGKIALKKLLGDPI